MKNKFGLLLFVVLLFSIHTLHLGAQTANFTATPSSGCAPLNVTFTNTSSGSSSYSWTFGNGNTSTQTSPSAIYYTPGSYTVTLTTNTGQTHSVTITVYANPVASFTTSTLPACAGSLVSFNSTSTIGGGPINSYAWDFGDGNGTTTVTGNTTHSYANGGTFPVTLIITDVHGCTNSVILQVSVLPAPVAAFSGSPISNCVPPLTVNFTNASSSTGLTTYSWAFGDGGTSTAQNPTHIYNTTGNYSVTLVVTQGSCSDTLTLVNYITIHNIVAGFTSNVTSGCAGTAVSFTDASSPLSVSRNWNFGDGFSSTAANPTHTYNSPGTYTVSLLNATDPSGCSDDDIVVGYITIYPAPVVNFTANQTVGCTNPFTVTFNNTSTNGSTYSWSFGDGGSSTAQNPVHTYLFDGNYTVTLWVTSANGCVNSFTIPNYIHVSEPRAYFYSTLHEGCAPLPVNFYDTSYSPNDPIVSYHWTFGDGSPAQTTSTPSVYHLYSLPGTYTVTLLITTSAGCTATLTLTNYVLVGTPPVAAFTVMDSVMCYGVPAVFNDLSTNADSALWLFGDGGHLSLDLPFSPVAYVFQDTGTFFVIQIAFNNGCPDSIRHNFMVHVLPAKPHFTDSTNCSNPYSVTFTNTSEGADSIVWNFNDGSPLVSNVNVLNHVFSSQGSHSVTITAWNFQTGCSFSYTGSVTILVGSASFTATPPAACAPFQTVLTSTSVNASTYYWILGDGTQVPNVTFLSHYYQQPGVYNAQLIILDVFGCVDTATVPINAWGPTPDFSASPVTGCTPLTVTFTDQTIDSGTLSSWIWIFGDGTISTVTTPVTTHTYTVSGTYNVTMTVTDIHGCTKSITHSNYISATFPHAAMAIDTFACAGDLLTFNSAGTTAAGPAIYSWTFGDGTTGIGNIVTHSYSTDGTYPVTFTISDVNGCSQTLTSNILIQSPSVAFRDSVTAQGCGFTTVHFFDMSTGIGINQWHWLFGDGASSTQPNPIHTYSTPGYYTVTLLVTNAGPCSGTYVGDSIVLVQGPYGTFSFFPPSGCTPLTVHFTATSGNTQSFTWDFGDGTVVTTVGDTISHTYTHDIVATPILLMTDTLPDGTICQLPAPPAGQITVATTVHVEIDSTIIILTEGETEPLNATVTGVNGTPSFLWSPSTLLDCSTCQNTIVTGDDSGQTITYTLTVTDSGGCRGLDTVTIIYLRCDDNSLLIPNVFSPNGDRLNDLFLIKGLCLKTNFLIQIFNRWGIKVFETTDRNNSWDGKINGGADASDGVYYYIITLDKTTYTGFVQVIR